MGFKKYILTASIVLFCLASGFWLTNSLQKNQQQGPSSKKVLSIKKKAGEWTIGFEENKQIPFTRGLNQADLAINLAKSAHTFNELNSNENEIRNEIRKMKGRLKIYGWKSEKAEDDETTYIVRYGFDNGKGIYSYVFEVNMLAEIVRSVAGDPELEAKYNVNRIKKERAGRQ